MAHQRSRTSLEGILRIFQPRLEEFVQARGAGVALAMPGLRILILWLRKMLGAESFDKAMKEGLSTARIATWFLPFARGGFASTELGRIVGELVAEVGASLAVWGKETSNEEVAILLEEELRGMGWDQVLGIFGIRGAIGGGQDAIVDISDAAQLIAHHPLCPLAPDLYLHVRGKAGKSQRVRNRHVQVRPYAILGRLTPPVPVCRQCEPLFVQPGHGHGPSAAEFMESIPGSTDRQLFMELYAELMRTNPNAAARVRWAVHMGFLTHAVVREMLAAPGSELEMLEAHIPVMGLRAVFGGLLTRLPGLARVRPAAPAGRVERPLREARDRLRAWRERTFN